MKVLHGARDFLGRYRPVVLVEVETRHHHYPIQKVFSWLRELGFEGYFVDPAPHFLLRSYAEFDTAAHQDMPIHGKGEFQRYLNNFFFVPTERAARFERRVR